MKTCLIFNPAAGRSRAARRLQPFLNAHAQRITVMPTSAAGDAERLAFEAVQSGFELILAAGGDGTVHEITNGILNSNGDPTLGVIPLGSANDYADALRTFGVHRDPWEGDGHLVDVGRLTVAETGRSRFFVTVAGCGLVGEISNASQHIRYLQGFSLYGLAAAKVIRRMGSPPEWRVKLDDKPEKRQPYRSLSVLIGSREGRFCMAPDAELNDGVFDVIEMGNIGVWEGLRLLPRFVIAGCPDHHPRIERTPSSLVTIHAEADLYIHTDGEMFSVAGDGIRNVSMEILRERLRVKLCQP